MFHMTKEECMEALSEHANIKQVFTSIYGAGYFSLRNCWICSLFVLPGVRALLCGPAILSCCAGLLCAAILR